MKRTHPLNTEIHQAVVDWIDAGREFALALVVRDAGSTPRKAGTKAIIDAAGAIWGTVGGGPLEFQVQHVAVEAVRSRQAVLLDYEFAGQEAAGERPICGGSMRVLIDPNVSTWRTACTEAAQARQKRVRGLLVTAIRGGAPPEVNVQWFAQEALPAQTGYPGVEALRRVLESRTPAYFEPADLPASESLQFLIEPVGPDPRLLIIGGGHVGQALARQAALVGFEIVVVDDRREFTKAALFPAGTTTHCADPAEYLAGTALGAEDYVAIVSLGHRHDAEALAACIRKPAGYVGMMGSRRKVALVRREFIESSLATAEEFDRVHAPIGLDISAETVPEIAASIVAELVAVRRKGSSALRTRRVPG